MGNNLAIRQKTAKIGIVLLSSDFHMLRSRRVRIPQADGGMSLSLMAIFYADGFALCMVMAEAY
jgi:hypothetical protein